MYSRKVVIITNIPSPYRVDYFNYLHKSKKDYNFNIIYESCGVSNRIWNIESKKLINSYILRSKAFKISKKYDTRHIFFSFQIFKYLNKLNPDVVIAFEYNPSAIQAFIWCKINKKKFINLTDGTLWSERRIGIFQKISRKFICYNADAFICSSTKAKEKILSYGGEKTKIFISLLTIDIQHFINYNCNPNSNSIIYVGSLIERKGIDLLLRSLANIKVDFDLKIVGDGSKEDKDTLIKIIEEEHLQQRVNFCGFLEGNELIKAYQNSSIFVLPTREDCYGLVILEAMCFGLPVIVSQYADGVCDLVKDNINGHIVNPYDSISLSNSIENLLTDKHKRIKMGINSKIYAKNFTFSSVSDGFIKALKYTE